MESNSRIENPLRIWRRRGRLFLVIEGEGSVARIPLDKAGFWAKSGIKSPEQLARMEPETLIEELGLSEFLKV